MQKWQNNWPQHPVRHASQIEFRNQHIQQQLICRSERCCHSRHIRIRSGTLDAFAGDSSRARDERRSKGKSEQGILGRFDNHNRHGAFRVVILHLIDPTADGIITHQPGVERFQQIREQCNLCHSRIEPQIVVIWLENYGHSVVGLRCHRIWGLSSETCRT
jgi:hypothetical protein